MQAPSDVSSYWPESDAMGPTVPPAWPPVEIAGAAFNCCNVGLCNPVYVSPWSHKVRAGPPPTMMQAAPQAAFVPSAPWNPTTVAVSPGGDRAETRYMFDPTLPPTFLGQPREQNIHIPPGMMLVQSQSGRLLLIPQQPLAPLHCQPEAQDNMAPGQRSLPASRQLIPEPAAFAQQSLLPQRASAPVSSSVFLDSPAPHLTVPVSRTQLQAGVLQPRQQRARLTLPVTPMVNLRNQAPWVEVPPVSKQSSTPALKKKQKKADCTFIDDKVINNVVPMAGLHVSEESAYILVSDSGLPGLMTHSCKDEAFLSCPVLQRRMQEIGSRCGVTDLGGEVVNFVSHATKQRLQDLMEKVSVVAQQKNINFKEDDTHERISEVRAQLKSLEDLEQLEKQRKQKEERETLLKAAKFRGRQDPEKLRLIQKREKEMLLEDMAQIRHEKANQTALAAIGPRKKILDSSSSRHAAEGSGRGPGLTRQRITRVHLRDLLLCLEEDRFASRSLLLYFLRLACFKRGERREQSKREERDS